LLLFAGPFNRLFQPFLPFFNQSRLLSLCLSLQLILHVQLVLEQLVVLTVVLLDVISQLLCMSLF
jgi:hypothetical protein